MEDGELEKKRGEAEGSAGAPDFEGEDFVDETARTDVADLLGDIGLQPGVVAGLPESVTCGIRAAAGGDEVNASAVVSNADGDVANFREIIAKMRGEGGLQGGDGPGSEGGEAQEEIGVAAAAKRGAFRVRAGERDGFEARTRPAAQGCGERRGARGGRREVAIHDGAHINVFWSQDFFRSHDFRRSHSRQRE